MQQPEGRQQAAAGCYVSLLEPEKQGDLGATDPVEVRRVTGVDNRTSEGITRRNDNNASAKLMKLSEWAEETATRELGETPKKIKNGIDELRKLIEERKLGGNEKFSDQFLLRFLRARKYKIDAAYRVLERYCETIRQYPECRKPSALKKVWNQNLSCMLPERDALGRRVFLFRAGAWEPSECSLWDIFRTNLACLELASREPDTQVAGLVALVDMRGLNLKQVRCLSPMYARNLMKLLQDGYPLRFKAIHIANEPLAFQLVYRLLKPFLSEKLTKRLHCHGSSLRGSLRKNLMVAESAVPRDLGGFAGNASSWDTYTALTELETTGWPGTWAPTNPPHLTNEVGETKTIST